MLLFTQRYKYGFCFVCARQHGHDYCSYLRPIPRTRLYFDYVTERVILLLYVTTTWIRILFCLRPTARTLILLLITQLHWHEFFSHKKRYAVYSFFCFYGKINATFFAQKSPYRSSPPHIKNDKKTI